MADTSTLSPEANMPGSPGCPVVKVKSEYLLGIPPSDPLRGTASVGLEHPRADADRASPDSVFPDAASIVGYARVVEDQQQQQQQQQHHQPHQQQQRSATPTVATRLSPYSPMQAVSTTPMHGQQEQPSSRSDSPEKADLSSAQTKEESDNSVFDGGGGRSEASSQPSHRSSPSSQYSPSQSASPVQQQQQQTGGLRGSRVPPHLLAHHQFWSSQNNGFATQRLLNGVISSAVSYAGQTVAVASTSSGGAASSGGSGNGASSAGQASTGPTTAAPSSCK